MLVDHKIPLSTTASLISKLPRMKQIVRTSIVQTMQSLYLWSQLKRRMTEWILQKLWRTKDKFNCRNLKYSWVLWVRQVLRVKKSFIRSLCIDNSRLLTKKQSRSLQVFWISRRLEVLSKWSRQLSSLENQLKYAWISFGKELRWLIQINWLLMDTIS